MGIEDDGDVLATRKVKIGVVWWLGKAGVVQTDGSGSEMCTREETVWGIELQSKVCNRRGSPVA